ncbi:Histidinol dehydrogenase [Gammaproteobacteria bacterium]
MHIKVYELEALSSKEKSAILGRNGIDTHIKKSNVAEIVDNVRLNGMSALKKYALDFDKMAIDEHNIKVTPEEFKKARALVPPNVVDAIKVAIINIKKFHVAQKPTNVWLTEIDEGIFAGEKVTPIESVGIYVPRGKGSFSQIVVRLGVPAMVAGVENIIICTPPMSDGSVDPATLLAAELVGIKHVYKVGGAHAIAAMAYGVDGVLPKVNKIVGPGNEYVVAAKSLLHSVVDVGIPAGISESIILADGTADPYNVALDWLIESEHGPDSPALLVTFDRDLAEKAMEHIRELVKKVPEEGRKYCIESFARNSGVILTKDMDSAVDFINQYAPEHIEIMTEDPMEIFGRIKNAGEILLGKYTPISIANFTLGPTAVLPTGGFARTFSGVSIHDFMKRTSVGYLTKAGFLKLRGPTRSFAEYSHLIAHAMAVSERKI